jgi:hypothetical protein
MEYRQKNIIEITDVVKNILYSSKNRTLNYETVSSDRLVKDTIALFKVAGPSAALIEDHRHGDYPKRLSQALKKVNAWSAKKKETALKNRKPLGKKYPGLKQEA